jgi:hypothetical protein
MAILEIAVQIGLMEGHGCYTIVGNVLGDRRQNSAPFSALTYEAISVVQRARSYVQKLGYNAENWNTPAGPKCSPHSTLIRDGNFDYATNQIHLENVSAPPLPNRLYIASKPAFFGSYVWP